MSKIPLFQCATLEKKKPYPFGVCECGCVLCLLDSSGSTRKYRVRTHAHARANARACCAYAQCAYYAYGAYAQYEQCTYCVYAHAYANAHFLYRTLKKNVTKENSGKIQGFYEIPKKKNCPYLLVCGLG